MSLKNVVCVMFEQLLYVLCVKNTQADLLYWQQVRYRIQRHFATICSTADTVEWQYNIVYFIILNRELVYNLISQIETHTILSQIYYEGDVPFRLYISPQIRYSSFYVL